MKSRRSSVKIRLRICRGDEIAIGPGKASLLECIDAEGTLAAAGRKLGMSYKRAWTLVETMNRCFQSPLVETCKGGATRGGSSLTPLGRTVLERYRAMEAAAAAAIRDDARVLESRLAR